MLISCARNSVARGPCLIGSCGTSDPMVVIRWKDIYERLEEAIDACEHVANVLEGIVIKNS